MKLGEVFTRPIGEPKSKGKGSSILGAIAFLLLVGAVYLFLKPSGSTAPATPKAVPQLSAEDLSFAKKLVDSGLVEKINPQSREVFVDPQVWTRLNVEQKTNLLTWGAKYCAKAKGSDVEFVTVYDFMSGKKLAKSDVLGVKFY